MLKPTIPLPEPLRGSDRGTFTERSVKQRLPTIARNTLEENELSDEQTRSVEQLIAEIGGGVITGFDESLPDADEWVEHVSPFLGMSWLDVPWFFAEGYFYRRLLAATGFSMPGPRQGVDPFLRQKQTGLAGSASLAPRLGHLLDDPSRLLRASLWANRVDLSLLPAGEEEAAARTAQILGVERDSYLLVDDTDAAIELVDVAAPRVHIVLDNSGAELVADLALIAHLLVRGGRVTIHLKPHPAFVSDVTRTDFTATIERLADEPAPADRIVDALRRGEREGRLRTTTSSFWVSPLPIWKMPGDLLDELAGADLVIVKGDYNYRRLLGDLSWEPTVPLGDVVRPLQPVLALRVCKSLTAAGLPQSIVETTSAADPDWMSNGEWGMIQLRVPLD